MKIFSKLALYLISFCVYSNVYTQTFDELYQKATAKSHEVRVFELNYDAAYKQKEQVYQWPALQIGVGIGALPTETRLGSQRLKGSVFQMLPQTSLLHSKEEAIVIAAQSEKEKIRSYLLDMRFVMEQAYYRLYEINERKKILTNHIQIFNSLERITLSKVESGKANLSDVLRVKIKTQEFYHQIQLLENERNTHFVTINRFTGDPLTTEIKVSEQFELLKINFDRTTLEDSIRSNHPNIQALEWKKKASKKWQDVTGFVNKPVLGLGLDYGNIWERDDSSPVHNGRDVVIPKVMLRVPLSKSHLTAKVEEEALNQTALSQQQEAIVDQYMSNIEKALVQYDQQIIKTNFYNKQIKTTQSAIDILLSAYSSSGKGIDEIIEMENDLLNYETQLIQAIVQTHMQQARINKHINFEL